MRYKIIVGLLVLAILVSLGFNVYYHIVANSEQVAINNTLDYVVLSWARETYDASIYLAGATTNVDMFNVAPFFYAGENIAWGATQSSNEALFGSMAVASIAVYEAVMQYTNGTPSVRLINPAALGPIRTLASSIKYTAGLLVGESPYLTANNGVDPSQLLMEKGVLNQTMSGLDNIKNLTSQVYNFTPPLQ
jgi:hypothetical protein